MLRFEGWLVLSTSILFLVIVVIRLNWRQKFPVYLMLLLLLGLTDTWISHMLVLQDYLEFPHRLFPDWTLNNVVYDLWVLPAFLLLLVDDVRERQRPWLTMTLAASGLTLQDYWIETYTNLLVLEKWTLWHTWFSTALYYWSAYWVYQFLNKNFTGNRSHSR